MRSCPRRCRWLVAVVLSLAVVTTGGSYLRADGKPQGKEIAEIIPIGNKLHTTKQILTLMQTKSGKTYDEKTIEEDVRRLFATRWFLPGGVLIRTRNDSDGRLTIFVLLTELTSVVKEIVYDGVKHLSKSELDDLTALRKGDPLIPSTVELGRFTILRRYQEDGYFFASVEVAEGNKPTDTRVVYRIVEGPIPKVSAVEFAGNAHVTTSRLRAQLTAKQELLKSAALDRDWQALNDYYHMLGFRKVEITREVRGSADLAHVTIVYHIVEGEREDTPHAKDR